MKNLDSPKNIDNKFMVISVFFISLMLISNLLACKPIMLFNFVVTPGILIYPFSFMLGDILTELYGFKNVKNVILVGFLVQFCLVIFSYLAMIIPAPDFWEGQQAFETIFKTTPQIVIGSLLAFLIGNILNSFTMEKIKKVTKGKFLWIRTIGSTIVGEIFDSIIFISIAFLGRMPNDAIIKMIIIQIIGKVLIEVILGTPLVYLFVYKFNNSKKPLDFNF